MLISTETDLNSLSFSQSTNVVSLYNLDPEKLQAAFEKIADNAEILKNTPFKAAFLYQNSSPNKEYEEIEMLVRQYREVLFQLKNFTGTLSLDIPDEDTFDNIFTPSYKKKMAPALLNRIKFHGSNAKAFTERLQQNSPSEKTPVSSTANIVSQLQRNSNQRVDKASNDTGGFVYVDEDYLKTLEEKNKSNTTLIETQADQIRELQEQVDSCYGFINQQQDTIHSQETEIERLKNLSNQANPYLENAHTKKRFRG